MPNIPSSIASLRGWWAGSSTTKMPANKTIQHSKFLWLSAFKIFLMLTFFSFQHTQKSWIRLAGIPVTSNSESHILKWLLFYFKACLPYTKSKWLSYPVIQGLSTRYSWPLYCIQNLNQGSKLNHKPRTLIQIEPSSVHTFSFKPDKRTYQTEPLWHQHSMVSLP